MAITTLVGTTWLLKAAESISLPQYELVQDGAYIDFTSNGRAFTNFYVGSSTDKWIKYGVGETFDTVYYNIISDFYAWDGEGYRAIKITGGADATSASANFADILAWLQSNGTLITPNVVLKNGGGTAQTYNGVENVKIANTEGNDITFRDTIDGCALPNKILSGNFAYGYNGKVNGNIPIQSGYTVTENGTLATSGKYFSGNIVVKVLNPLLNSTTPLHIKAV